MLMSPRNEKIPNNSYVRVARPRRRIDEDAGAARNAPLDFDKPHPRVLAALAAGKRSLKSQSSDGEDGSLSAQAPAPAPAESERSSEHGDETGERRKSKRSSRRRTKVTPRASAKGSQKQEGGAKNRWQAAAAAAIPEADEYV